jgi:hypothetical protein
VRRINNARINQIPMFYDIMALIGVIATRENMINFVGVVVKDMQPDAG